LTPAPPPCNSRRFRYRPLPRAAPVDPADVRKVVLEEPPANLAMADPKVVAARRAN